MNQFLVFVTKEFRHILRDRMTTTILIALPMLMLFLFGFAITTEVKNTNFAVYAPTPDNVTRDIVRRLQANEYFILKRTLTAPEQIQEVFARGEVGLVVRFSDDFQDQVQHTGTAQVQLITDGTDPNTAMTLAGYAQSIVADYQLDQLSAAAIPYRINTAVKLLYNPTMKGAYNFVPGVIGMVLLLVCAMMTSIAIAREKELGTMEVLLVSPVRPLQLILAKTVPYLAISILDFTLILVVSVTVLKVPIVGSLVLLYALALIYIFLALALGILVSSVADSQATALLISGMGMMMPVMMLSGMMFSIDNMPMVLQTISMAIPARWFIAAVSKVMIRGLGFAAVKKEMAILSGMAVALIALSLRAHRSRLE